LPGLLGLGDDGLIPVETSAGRARLAPIFRLAADDLAVASDPRIAAMDIGWAQILLGRRGRLDAIQILLDDPLHPGPVIARLRPLLPADIVISEPGRRGREVDAMLGAFQLNLTALSLVSLLVGMFLIYNAVAATVAGRRVEIGILRALGASRGEIRALFMGSSLLCAVIGILLGFAFAIPLADMLSGSIAQTISSLYALVRIDRLAFSPAQALAAIAVGLGATCLAAWFPADEAAATDPAKVLHPGSAMDTFPPIPPRWLCAGAACIVGAAITSLLALHTGPALLGFVSAFLVVIGFSFAVPWVVRSGGLWSSRMLRHGPETLRLAAQNLVRSGRRNSVTIAALAVAIAMTVGVSVMIFSFRTSVDRWIGRTLRADLFVAPASNDRLGLQAFLDAGIIDWLSSDPRVAALGTYREVDVNGPSGQMRVAVVGGEGRGPIDFMGGGGAAKTLALASPGTIAVSESLSRRLGAVEGGVLDVDTPVGRRSLRVIGVFKDYSRDRGLAMMDRGAFVALWGDPRVHSLSVLLRPGADEPALRRELAGRFGTKQPLSIYSNRALKRRVFEIFDQTFAVTGVLRGISVLVAVVGVFLSLTVLVSERSRDIGVFRAIGASGGQVRAIVLGEAGLIGLLASLVGMASGVCLSLVLTWVINRAFFGWTIDLSLPVGLILATPLWIVPVALAAAWFPASRAAAIPPATALRFE